ncbi:aquaporin TIP3-1-like [Panicum miliaceum]|uniref:Aquaporin TIP3-1-like n=1 Tax=Panicum miliaceum TaxID=4540 RepID=A0A3L6TGF1_PANMI|nr:aquaporin TIP3-1-like [Panicum miliaceum]
MRAGRRRFNVGRLATATDPARSATRPPSSSPRPSSSLPPRAPRSPLRLPEYALAGGITGWHAAVLESAMAFGLMYAYYATAMDPRGRHAPLAVELLAGANVLACGALVRAGDRGLAPLGQPLGVLGGAHVLHALVWD